MAFQDRVHIPVTRAELPWALRVGAVGGIVAGIVFAVFEMVASAAMMGMDAFFMPLRMIGAILLGPAALAPAYPLFGAIVAAVIVHMALSVIYGMVFTALVGRISPASWEVGLGAVYGFLLWIINFYLIAAVAFPWFLEAPPVVQFIGHTFFFGAVLGWYVWLTRRAATPAGSEPQM
jgi:hypothetical protein